uniref:ORF 169b n=1 Tax=Lactococcus phage mv4 TaxID=12392 RepID=Q9G0D6_BPMV4|nr:ORF 169b [Lactobacillus phage mv4]
MKVPTILPFCVDPRLTSLVNRPTSTTLLIPAIFVLLFSLSDRCLNLVVFFRSKTCWVHQHHADRRLLKSVGDPVLVHYLSHSFLCSTSCLLKCSPPFQLYVMPETAVANRCPVSVGSTSHDKAVFLKLDNFYVKLWMLLESGSVNFEAHWITSVADIFAIKKQFLAAKG